MTRTTTRPTQVQACRTLVEHFDNELSDENPSVLGNDAQEVALTIPTSTISQKSEHHAMKLEEIENEVTRLLTRTLRTKRFTSRILMRKGLQKIVVSVNGYLFDIVKDKVSCSAIQALIVDKTLLRELIESSAKKSCHNIAGARFVRFTPLELSDIESRSRIADSFAFEVDFT